MSFSKRHPIIFNAVMIITVGFVIGYIALFAIDIFTGHGEYKTVPDVKNLPLREAIQKLEEAGFKWEISDSTYNDAYKPGVIIEQDPKANTNVKALRTIYLTMNAMYPRLVTLPSLSELSYRQGRSMLEGMGFKNIIVDTVASPYKELILSVTANGKAVEAGTRLPLSAQIRLTIGDGSEEEMSDSLPNSGTNGYNGNDAGDKNVDFF